MITRITNIVKFMKLFIISLLLTIVINFNVKGQKYFNVMDFGAINNTSKKSTTAIKNAIDAAVKTGGGTIYFPAGEYLTGPIHLQSNITVFIDAGAVIKFSDDFDDYLPMVPSRWEGNDVVNFSPLFYAYKAENIAIIGQGTIDGQGKKWWDFLFDVVRKPNKGRSKWQVEFEKNNTNMILPDDSNVIKYGFLRPPFIQPMYCKNVLIEGIKIYNSPFWTVNPEFCDNVTIKGVTIINPISPNTDGINPESCRNVHISDCHISVGDDCITIKSGRDSAGRKMNVPAENYTITNCTMLSGHGGVVIGSEMSGGVKKIVISNCVFDGTDRGIRIKSTRGRGGVVEDIRVSNIVMRDIRMEAVTLNLFYNRSVPESVSERTPQFRNIHISNITGNAKQAASLLGLAEMPINNVSFSDINLKTQIGFIVSNSENIKFHNMQINTGTGPAIFVEKSSMIEIDGLKDITPLSNSPVIEFNNVKEAFIHNCYQPVETNTFLKVDGAFSENITLSGNNLLRVKTEVDTTNIVPGKAIIKL
jgi:polygalacturonase